MCVCMSLCRRCSFWELTGFGWRWKQEAQGELSNLDIVLESIQAPRFIDFSEMMSRDDEAKQAWRLSMGNSDSFPPQAQLASPSVHDDDDFRSLPPRISSLLSCATQMFFPSYFLFLPCFKESRPGCATTNFLLRSLH